MLASLFPWLLYICALVSTLTGVHFGHPFWSSLLLYVVIFNGGLQGLWAALGHLAFPNETAKKIGWVSNGFQTEIGSANLAIGVIGVLTYFFHTWAMPSAVFIVVFFSGCAYMHIKDRIKNQNKAPCNSGPMLYSTILIIITLLLCILANLI